MDDIGNILAFLEDAVPDNPSFAFPTPGIQVLKNIHWLICTTFAGGNPLKWVEEAME